MNCRCLVACRLDIRLPDVSFFIIRSYSYFFQFVLRKSCVISETLLVFFKSQTSYETVTSRRPHTKWFDIIYDVITFFVLPAKLCLTFSFFSDSNKNRLRYDIFILFLFHQLRKLIIPKTVPVRFFLFTMHAYEKLSCLCCSVYKAQFLKRMDRLLDNLPEKDVSTTSLCSIQTSSTPRREVDSAVDSTSRNAPSSSDTVKPTHVPSLAVCSVSSGTDEITPGEVSSSVQSGRLQNSVCSTEHVRLLKAATGCRPSAAQNESFSTTSGQCCSSVRLSSQEPSVSQTAASRQLSHSAFDVTVTRDILPSSVVVKSSSGAGGLLVITAPSNYGRSIADCVTTASCSDRGVVSPYDTSLHHTQSASAQGLDISRPTSAPQRTNHSHNYNRPLIGSDQQRTVATTRSTVAYDWITTRCWVFSSAPTLQ